MLIDLSFGSGVKCTDLCNEGCAGVFWDGENCKLIQGDEIVVTPEADLSEFFPIPYFTFKRFKYIRKVKCQQRKFSIHPKINSIYW